VAAPAQARFKLDKRVQYALLAPSALLGLAVVFFPYLAADTLEPVGFDPYPYGGGSEQYTAGPRSWAVSMHGGGQYTEGQRTSLRGGGRFTTAGRLGADFEWTGFDEGALGDPGKTEYYAGHFLANVSEEANQISEWGVGVARITGRDDRWGGSLGLRWEAFNQEPWTLHGRYQLGVLTDQRAYHDLSFHIGLVWTRLGLSAGYRAFLNPRANSYGPEALLRLWL
jgi:hypothetical protein